MVSRPAPSQPVLRDGQADDLDVVMEVMEKAFRPCFGEGWTRSQCSGILPMNGVRLRLAGLAGARASGFALMRVVADEAELLLIAVHPEMQRGGIGQALLDDFVGHARRQGASHLHLEMHDGNPAMGLYSANGFAIAGRRREYYHGPNGEHYDALTLVLRD